MNQARRRYYREYNARRRGTTSYKSLAEDAAVYVAYAACELSEAQACLLLGLDVIDFRERCQVLMSEARQRWQEWRAQHPPGVGA